jgi:putative ABC transport system permease protein
MKAVAKDHRVGSLVLVGAAGIAAALFASWFAARRVTSLEPLEVLRADARTLGGSTRSHRFVALWATLVAMSAIALALEVRLQSTAWGNAGSTLWWASSIVIAVPLVHATSSGLGRVLGRLFGPEGQVAAASMQRAPTRTGVTVAAIALVLTLAITVASLSLSHRNSVRNYFVNGFLASDLAVTGVATEGGWLESPIPAGIATDLRMIPGIRRTEMWRVLPGVISQRSTAVDRSDGLRPRAPSPSRAGRVIRRRRRARSATARASTAPGELAIVSKGVGSTIDLDTPTGVRTVPSSASSLTTSRTVDDPARPPAVHRALAETAVNRSTSSLSRASAETVGGDPPAVRPSLPVKVRAWTRGRYLSGKSTRPTPSPPPSGAPLSRHALAGVRPAARRSVGAAAQLAPYRIGADDRVVRRSVVIESATIGVLGAVLGLAVGVVTTWIWVRINYRHLLGYYLDLHFAFGTTLWFVALVLAATTAAGWGAARHATRQPILDGIQVE